jgi:hypothetical protein
MSRKIISSRISVFASIALSGFLGLTGCSDGGGSSAPIATATTTTLSGVAVDGYLSESLVEAFGVSVNTDKIGKWTLPEVVIPPLSRNVITVSGGTDIATGEKFEGRLTAIPSTKEGEKTAVTPLSSLSASLYKKGTPKADAEAKIAKTLNLPVEALTSDPIATLANGTPEQKKNAAVALQRSLQVQKASEVFSKSVSGAQTGLNSNTVGDAFIDSFATILDSGADIDAALKDTKAISTAMATELSAGGPVDDSLSKKLDGAADSALDTINLVGGMDLDELINAADAETLTNILNSKSKSLEIASSAIEARVELFAELEDLDGLDALILSASEASDAMFMLGGIEGLSAKLDASLAGLEEGKTIDASDFADSFITDDFLAAQALTFSTLSDGGFDLDTILNIGASASEAATKGDVTSDFLNDLIDQAIASSETLGDDFSFDNNLILGDLLDNVLAAELAHDAAAELGIIDDLFDLEIGEDGEITIPGEDGETPVVVDPDINEDGEIVGEDGETVGEVTEDGEVVDEDGEVIGDIVEDDDGNIIFIPITGGSTGTDEILSTEVKLANADVTSFDDLEATGTIGDNNITVDSITDASLSNNIFSLERTAIEVPTIDSLTLSEAYTAIEDSIDGLLNIKLTATDFSTTSLNKEVLVTVLVSGTGGDYVAVSTNANFTNNGNLNVAVPSGNVLRIGTSIDETTLTATKANASTNIVTSSTVNGNEEISINATNIITSFSNNALIGDTIKQYMVDYTTSAGSYNVYLFINDVTDNSSFIGDNSVLFNATGLDTLVSDSGVNYATSEKAVQVKLTITE